MADRLRERATERGAAVTVVGPAPAYIARRADRWRWNVVLRGDDPVAPARRRRRRAVVGRRRPGIAALGIGVVGRDHRQMPGRPGSCDDVGHQTTEEPRHDDRAARPQHQRPADPRRDLHLDRRTGLRIRRARRASGSAGPGASAGAERIVERRDHRDRDPRVDPRGDRRPGRARHADRPRVLGARRRARRGRRGQGRAAGQDAPATPPPTRAASSPSGRASWASELRASLADERRGIRTARRPGGAARRQRPMSRRRPHPTPVRPRPTARPRADPSRSYTPRMSVRPIVLLGDPRLRLKGKPVDSFGKYLHELLDDLAHTMRDAPGVGLAAPQLGEALQACVIEVERPALRAGEPEDRPVVRRRPRPRGLPVDPGLRRLRHAARAGLGRRPEPARQEDQGRRDPGCSVARSSTSSTTSTASSTSTISTRWTS